MDTLEKVPGRNLLYPMLITSVFYTFFPSILTVGEPFSNFFESNTTLFLIGIVLFVSGSQIDYQSIPKVGKIILPLAIVKIGLALLLCILWNYLFEENQGFGLSVVTIISTIMSCNPGLYLALLGNNASEVEKGIFPILNILMLPAIPLFILSIGQEGVSIIKPLVGNLLPVMIGIVVGNAFPPIKEMYKPLTSLLLPFLGISFGSKINLLTALESWSSGLLLTILFYIVAVLPLYFVDKKLNSNGGRISLGMGSVAAFSISVPTFISTYMPIKSEELSTSSTQIAFVVILTSIFTPILFSKRSKIGF